MDCLYLPFRSTWYFQFLILCSNKSACSSLWFPHLFRHLGFVVSIYQFIYFPRPCSVLIYCGFSYTCNFSFCSLHYLGWLSKEEGRKHIFFIILKPKSEFFFSNTDALKIIYTILHLLYKKKITECCQGYKKLLNSDITRGRTNSFVKYLLKTTYKCVSKV